MGTYDTHTGFFENRSKLEDLPVQSPIPLSKSFRYFVVTQQEVSLSEGKGASVGLATCSVSRKVNFRTSQISPRNISFFILAIETNANVYVNERLLYLVC